MSAVAADAAPAGAGAGSAPAGKQQQQQAAPPANRSKKQEGGSKKKKGGRGAAPAEEVEVKGGQVNLVRLRYEGKQEAVDDPTRVQLSKVGKASQLQLSEDRLGVTGHKGFKTARASHGVHEGAWYCEVRGACAYVQGEGGGPGGGGQGGGAKGCVARARGIRVQPTQAGRHNPAWLHARVRMRHACSCGMRPAIPCT